VYGADDEKRGYRRLAPDVLHPKTKVTQGICNEEAAELMKKFFREKR
jgi:tRNA(adenine34) deaminase